MRKPTCKEKTRKAGMGTMAAMKNAVMLLMDVRAMLVPERRRQVPMRSFEVKRSYHSEEVRRAKKAEEMMGGKNVPLRGCHFQSL